MAECGGGLGRRAPSPGAGGTARGPAEAASDEGRPCPLESFLLGSQFPICEANGCFLGFLPRVTTDGCSVAPRSLRGPRWRSPASSAVPLAWPWVSVQRPHLASVLLPHPSSVLPQRVARRPRPAWPCRGHRVHVPPQLTVPATAGAAVPAAVAPLGTGPQLPVASFQVLPEDFLERGRGEGTREPSWVVGTAPAE